MNTDQQGQGGGQAGSETAASLARGRGLAELARQLIADGSPDRAEQLARQARELFTGAGAELEAANALSIIADIRYERGEYDEVLRIRREILLPAYERLGAARETAANWGKIADIGYRRGEYEQAAELQRQRLAVNRELGDTDGMAATNWSLARIDLARRDEQAALPRLAESFRLYGEIGQLSGVAVAGGTLGQLLLNAGQAERARQVLGQARDAAEQIGWEDMVQGIGRLLEPPADDGTGHAAPLAETAIS